MGMQVGFIDFVVSPLALALFGLFPPLRVFGFQIVNNFNFFADQKIEELSKEVATGGGCVQSQNTRPLLSILFSFVFLLLFF